MTTDERDVASAVGAALAERVGRRRYETWFASHTRLTYDGDTLTVAVPNQSYHDWLRAHFRREVEEACRAAAPGDCRVCFAIAARTEAIADRSAALPRLAASPAVNGAAADNRLAHHLSERPMGNEASENATNGRRRWASLGDFVVGSSNRLAQAAAQGVVDRPGSLSPLVLHGPTGVGKTHLLEGIYSAARRLRHGPQALFLTAEQFTTQFVEALRGSGLPSFRRKNRGIELLVIDDAQFFVGKRATLIELLHTVDMLGRDGRQIVLALDRSPEELSGLGSELIARLQGGLPCRIEPPDAEVRLGIARQIAARMQLSAPEEVLAYVAARFTSHARELQGALNTLQAAVRLQRTPLTLALAQEALRDLVRQASRAVRLVDIEKAVCDVFGLEPASLQSERKTQQVSQPRMLAMFLARKLTRAAYSEIGQHFGRRKHTTVISAQKKVVTWMQQSATIRLHDRDCEVDEAVRRVEAALKLA